MFFKSVIGGMLAVSCLMAAVGDTRLPNAAMQGDRNLVTSLLAQKVDVNSAQGDGMTALHWAASKGDLAMATQLLNAGANLRAVTRIDQVTPLFGGATSGNVAMIAILVKAGADVNIADAKGTTPLMLAAASGNAESVRVLLEHNADPNAKDQAWGETALMYAAALNRAATIKELIQHGADVNVTAKVVRLDKALSGPDDAAQRAAAEAAAQKANAAPATADAAQKKPAAPPAAEAAKKRAQTGRQRGPSVMGGFTALHFAAREGAMDAALALVEGGANVNEPSASDQITAMTLAVTNGHLDLGKYLLDHGSDPKLVNSDGTSALFATIDAKWVNKSWYPQPSVDQEKITYLELMSDLLEHGADPNQQSSRGLWYRKGYGGGDTAGGTAFWRAAEANDITAMKLLVKAGADPNLVSKNGVSPLMMAAGLGYGHQTTVTVPDARLASIKYLVEECGADANAKDETGYTALHGAAFLGDDDLILYLVSKGADVTARSKPGAGRLGNDAEDRVNAKGDTVADYANGPRMNSLLFPDTVALLEKLGSENSHDCRSEACVLNTRPDKKPIAEK
jgi:ankyrin repeat protein